MEDVHAPMINELITMTMYRAYDAMWNNALRLPMPARGQVLDIDDYIVDPFAYRRANARERRPRDNEEARAARRPRRPEPIAPTRRARAGVCHCRISERLRVRRSDYFIF